MISQPASHHAANTLLDPSHTPAEGVRIRVGSSVSTSAPAWVRWLVDFGRSWECADRRRVAIISMPCDSAAAGLVTLGCVVGDLERPKASDVEGHFDSLIRYARQYLTACKDCPTRCQPRDRRCGYASEATGKLRHRSGRLLGPVVDFKESVETTITLRAGSGTTSLHPAAGMSYHVHQQPPIETLSSSGLDLTPYAALVPTLSALPENLRRSYSGICLAGRAAGADPTRNWYSAVRFEIKGNEYDLSELLTIAGWGARGVSRATFFNTRNDQFDRPRSFTRLVIADGDAALEKVLARKEFDRSDVIGVLHRTAPDDSAHALGERLAAMRQWYETVEPPPGFGQPLPRGVATQILGRRG